MAYLGGVGKEAVNKGVERYFLVDTSLPKFSFPYVSDETIDDVSRFLSELEEDDEPGENPDDFHTYFTCRNFLKRISSNKSASETEPGNGEETSAEEPVIKRNSLEYVPALWLLMQIEKEFPDIPEPTFKYPPPEQAGHEQTVIQV